MAPTPRDVLLGGEIEVRGRMPWSSNGTFLVEACLDGETVAAIYKPLRGERELWDFPRASTAGRWPPTSWPKPSVGTSCR